MERKRRISAPFLRTGLNNYWQSKTAAQPENTIIALIQAGIADNIFSPIILRLADTRRYDCGAVMLGQFLVTAVQNHIVLGVGQRSRLAVVRDQQPCDATEVVECMDMAVQPVLGFHVVAGFRVGVVAAGQNGDKQVGGALLACDRVLEGDGISSPVHLHGVPRLVLDAHGCRCNACPTAVTFTKLSAHVRSLARLLTLRAVFFP